MQTTDTYKFHLEKSPAIKGTCPKCEKPKVFRYYQGFDYELNFGICDRKNNCGHINIPTNEAVPQIKNFATPQPQIKIVYPPNEFCKKIIEDQTSNFHKFCIDKLKITTEHLKHWSCGTIEVKTAFVLQNKAKRYCNVKKIEYFTNGKRDKPKGALYLSAIEPGTKYTVCLFGEQNLSKDKIICLVESEKTAVISSFFYPEFDWLATGGAQNLTSDKMEVLYGRKVIYLCDADKIGTNNSSINKLKAGLQNCIIKHLFPDKELGYDLADAIIEGLRPEIEHIELDKPNQIIIQQKTEPFYKLKYDTNEKEEKYVKDVTINYTAWIELLYSFGFRRFDIGKNYIFVKIDKKIISEVTITQIQDYFISYLKSLVTEPGTGKLLIDKFYKNPAYYFCTNRLSLLNPNDKIIFNVDTQNESFTYFKNGFVRVTKEGWNLCDYSELNGYIWKEQILEKDFQFIDYKTSLENHPVFANFMFNISGKDEDRFRSLCSITGYNLHSYFETKLKATILTDSAISEDAEGRTGKTLYAKALGKIKRYVEIAGKDFKTDEKYKYSLCSLDTQIVHINDAKKYLDFESFYNDITEGITVERKNQQPFNVQVKMIFSTNKTIKMEGGSSRDRSIEFELSNHYSDKYSPQEEFKHWFFRDWDNEEWTKFYNFLIYCQWVYFEHGLIEPKELNLKKRKLLDHTCAEFVEFMEQEQIIFNEKTDRKQMHDSFLDAYTDCKTDKYKNQLKNFTKYLILYAQYTEGFADIKKDTHIGRTNNVNWIIFTKE